MLLVSQVDIKKGISMIHNVDIIPNYEQFPETNISKELNNELLKIQK